MKKGIMLPFFTEIKMEKLLDLIRKAGFTTFMLTLDSNYEKLTAPLNQVIDYCKKIELEVQVGHAGYKDPDVNNFWIEGKAGDKIESEYIKTLKKASKFGIRTVVYHLHFKNNMPLSLIGIERIKRMKKIAEELNVNIAIENLYKYDELEFIFNNIKSKNLGMCYDSGHENFLTPSADFLFKYGNRLMATHIHDNDGKTDQHKTPFTGTIDWNKLAKGYALANEISLESEVRIYKPERGSITERELFDLLKKEYIALERFEKMIIKESNGTL